MWLLKTDREHRQRSALNNDSGTIYFSQKHFCDYTKVDTVSIFRSKDFN